MLNQLISNELKHLITTGEIFNNRFSLNEAFAGNPNRFDELSSQACDILVDTSKSLWNNEVRNALASYAIKMRLDEKIDALFCDTPLNHTEGRSVLHTALRAAPFETNSPYRQEVRDVLERMYCFAEEVRENKTITDVVNIGIGGSDLGPQMVTQALQSEQHHKQRFHFVSNVDGHDLSETLHHLKPNNTLFIVCSKTFTTRETIENAKLAKAWFVQNGGQHIHQHFVAISTDPLKAKEFGIDTCFEFWNWVGGRYSLWGAVGLSIVIALGRKPFEEFLKGAWEMDQHFKHCQWNNNLPIQLGLLDFWNHSILNMPSKCIAPYHHGLRRLPAYLQQLEMESNGKSRQVDGAPVFTHTSPVVWGEAGTNGQHSFFQLIHQGTQKTSVEFIMVKKPNHAYEQSHRSLLSNALAQSMALMQGKSTEQALLEVTPSANPLLNRHTIAQHRTFSGNRPSINIVLPDLKPGSLGKLLALYEHRVFVHGVMCQINSYDQWGVELGKVLALETEQRLNDKNTTGLDASTAGLIHFLIQQ